jgi:anti-sigma regulatory factor (Ser/Thr protein kinase)
MTQELTQQAAMVATIRLPPEPASAPASRRFVEQTLTGILRPTSIDIVVLLTDELVTNAVVHAGTPIDVLVRELHGSVQIEVFDAGKQIPVVAERTSLSESGRGLAIVAALSADWGVNPGPDGKTVWFRCPS